MLLFFVFICIRFFDSGQVWVRQGRRVGDEEEDAPNINGLSLFVYSKLSFSAIILYTINRLQEIRVAIPV